MVNYTSPLNLLNKSLNACTKFSLFKHIVSFSLGMSWTLYLITTIMKTSFIPLLMT